MGSSPSSGSNSQQDDDDGVVETFETVEHEEYLIVGKNTSSQDILHPAIDQVFFLLAFLCEYFLSYG